MIRSELVQLWKSRVQYLRQYYCFNGHRPKQRGYPVLSRHVWFIPFILTAWWLSIAVIFLYKLKMQDLLNNGEKLLDPVYKVQLSLLNEVGRITFKYTLNASLIQKMNEGQSSGLIQYIIVQSIGPVQ